MNIKFHFDEETKCITPTSHKLNKDGYFRKRINGELKMFHRHVWEIENDVVIPEGYEINHLCKNRACCNIDHLECIDGSEHTILTNVERYADRKEKAKEYWLKNEVTGTELGRLFNVSFSAACGWIRSWKL